MLSIDILNSLIYKIHEHLKLIRAKLKSDNGRELIHNCYRTKGQHRFTSELKIGNHKLHDNDLIVPGR